MIKKKIDDQISVLMQNAINTNERGMFIIIGDKGRDQISNLHYFYSKLNAGKNLNILWCYKKELGFSNHAKKKMRKIKKQMNKGVYEPNDENTFDLFISKADIKFCFYHDTQRILGNTYGMLILQDFEAITPNLLCRTIETVQGGGLVIFLLSNMTSLKQLYTLTMDVHDRYRTESNDEVQPRFNERFILSLSSCKNCLCIDDEMNVLPITSNMKNMKESEKEIDEKSDNVFQSKREKELQELIKQMNQPPIGPLISMCKTLDQAKGIMLMVNAIAEKSAKNTVSMTSARGRGKSSAMGLAVSSAICYGYSNIIVTAPSPENLKTFFEFVIIGLKALNYQEHKDYTIQEGVGNFKGSIVNISIYKNHKQSIRYIMPSDVLIFQMAEMVVIDEAAAIPIHIVKKIMPDCLTFMASTIQGYEGTGRSLSLKLIEQLKHSPTSSKTLKEVTLHQAIRYADNDQVEAWLNKLLLLDATNADSIDEFDSPDKLELYLVNRDVLFSYHKASEIFLKRVMSLFVSSHYKNSPNDLQLLSDAPAHSIFVLCKSIEKSKTKTLPDVYCAIQVCEEGGISKDVVMGNSKRGLKPAGDLIPWTISEHYQDTEFPRMTGIRIVRIAVHPNYTKMGYGSRALQLLSEYYEGKYISLSQDEEMADIQEEEAGSKKKKKKLKPLLNKLIDIKPPFTYYLGTSFGLTELLFKFWSKNKYKPVYLKLTENDTTGEHSCIMIKPLKEDNINTITEIIEEEALSSIQWLQPFITDFKNRFVSLLSFDFSSLPIKLALRVLDPKVSSTTSQDEPIDVNEFKMISKSQLDMFLTKFDYKRIELYSKNMVNYSIITDLIPSLAKLFFTRKVNLSLSYIQAGVLLGFGLQNKSFDSIKEEFEVEVNQLLAMFNKMIKKFCANIKLIYEKEVIKGDIEIKAKLNTKEMEISQDIKNELKEEAQKIKAKDREEKRKFLEEKFSLMNKKRNRDDNNNKKINK